MKQKLLMLLAVLLTGGMLVACGPGDELADDTGGGIVDEPLGTETTDTLDGDTTTETFGDDAADTTADTGETVEMDLGEGEEVADDAAAEDGVAADAETDADVDVTTEETTEDTADDTTAEAGEGEDGDVAGGGAAPAAGEAVVVTFSQAAEGVAVENVQGAEDAESVASTDETNPDLNLTVGQRYEFEYDGEGDLVFFNSDNEALLSSAGIESAFAEDGEVQAEMEDGRVSFTLTEELAQELDHYAVGPEEQGGQVNAN
ncbi:MAG: hypothetical protein WD314_08870 [Trueperaceae bacterium]